MKDAELTATEMERFKFAEDASSNLFGWESSSGVPGHHVRKFSPLAQYLSKKLDRRVDLKEP